FIIRERKFDYGFLFRLGGMPSSHTASAAACATSVGLRSGFGSPVFALAAGLLALIMIDAQSVRRAAGVQARLLNQIAEDFYRNHKFSPDKLVEFLGHTRLEVLMGLLLGIVVALLVHGFFPEWAGPMPALNT
ncbi:MAG: divergent PAP2 family protein, partial [Kiritimatiellae bacterium]|nr:divergent PAP2 family protein [Kiritimatiellia bacterium]